MGYNVGTLSNVPLNLYDHCIFVVGDPKINKCADWIQRHFAQVVEKLPTKAALVADRGGRLSEEIIDLISRTAEDEAAGSLFAFLTDHTSLVIARGDIRTTNHPLVVVPLGGLDRQEGGAVDFMDAVFQSVFQAIRDEKLDGLLEQLGAVHVPLKPFKPGMWLATLRRANEVLQLKPSLFGVGINLNAAIDAYLETAKPTR